MRRKRFGGLVTKFLQAIEMKHFFILGELLGSSLREAGETVQI